MPDKLTCPFCGGPVRIVVCDDGGNYPQKPGYEDNPRNGLGYVLCHSSRRDAVGDCPIARDHGDKMGDFIYDTREAAERYWMRRADAAWIAVRDQLPPEGEIVWTMICDEDGTRNQTQLYRRGRLWFIPARDVYTYYTPTHWRPTD